MRAMTVAAVAVLATAGVQTVASQAGETDRPIHSIAGLAGPEAVHYDADQDVYFVSNFNGEAAGDANGFIARVGPDGMILEREFMTGTDEYPLHGPRGMRRVGGRLWVADADGLHAFDLASGAHLAFIDFRGFEPGFLNDVAATPDGALIVTDTGGAGRVFRVESGAVELVLDGVLASAPNGVVRRPDGLFVFAPWGGGRTLQAWRPGDEAPVDVGELPEGGHLDGIEVWRGGLLIASQDDRAIWHWTPGGARRLISTEGRPADIGIDTKRRRVAVPYIALDRVEIWALPD